jgi:hypothetical protein
VVRTKGGKGEGRERRREGGREGGKKLEIREEMKKVRSQVIAVHMYQRSHWFGFSFSSTQPRYNVLVKLIFGIS